MRGSVFGLIVLSLMAMQDRALAQASCEGCNVVLITIDTLRSDRIFGNADLLAPQTEFLLRDATVFENAYSIAPCTVPSVRQIITGHRRPKSEVPRLAEHFSAAGYRTAAFVSQHQFTIRPEVMASYARGFDTWFAQQRSERDQHAMSAMPAEDVVEAALAWLHSSPQPFFLWLHFFDPHDPYAPPRARPHPLRDRRQPLKEERDRRPQALKKPWYAVGQIYDEDQTELIRSFYDEEIAYLDGELARVLAALQRLGLFEHTAIALTSDHGERLGEDGVHWDHCVSLHHFETHVPLAIRIPGEPLLVPGGSSALVSVLDIAPTLLAATGLALPAGLGGQDLRYVGGQRAILANWRGQTSVSDGRFKLYARGTKPTFLYDLRLDPGETLRLRPQGEHAEVFERLKRVIETGDESLQAEAVDNDRELEALKALGYTE